MFCCIYAYVGDQIKAFLDEPTYKSLEADFKNTKLLSQTQKKPRIELEGEASINNKSVKVTNLS